MEIFWFILIGLCAGWLAGQLVKGSGFGVIGDIVVGILGAVIGGSLFGYFGIGGGSLLGSILVATVGAVVLLVVIRLIRGATAP